MDSSDNIISVKGLGDIKAKCFLANKPNTMEAILDAYVNGFSGISDKGRNFTVKGLGALEGAKLFFINTQCLKMVDDIFDTKFEGLRLYLNKVNKTNELELDL